MSTPEPPTPFKPGDHVHVAALGKGVVREARNGGRCLVDIKGRAMVVEAAQLRPVEVRKRRSASPPADASPTRPETLERSPAPASIDLHGMTTEEAVIALDAFVSDAILAGLVEVRVIHGRSGGRLKAAVHERAKHLTAIRGFRVDPSNLGVTIVTL